MINALTNEIICVHETKGAIHDFELYKQSEIFISGHIIAVVDKGYVGIDKLHNNSVIPHKKPKNGELTLEQKQFNRKISKFSELLSNMSTAV